MANQLTRSEVDADIESISDPLFSQNTAEKVRRVLKNFNRSAANIADDGLPTPGAGAGSFGALSGMARDNANLRAELDRPPNLRPGGPFTVRVVSAASPNYTAGSSTRDDLNPDLLCLGTSCRSEYADNGMPGGQTDILVSDYGNPANALQVWNDGNFTYKLPAKWVPVESPEARTANIAPYASFPMPHPFRVNDAVSAPFGGRDVYFLARVAGVLPAPSAATGDANWRVFNPQTNTRLAATVSEATFVAAYADAALGTYSNQDVYITERAGGGGPVMVHVGGLGSFEPDGLLFDPANENAPAAPVTVRVVAGAVVTESRTAGYVYKGLFPVGTATAVRKYEVYTNAAGVPFEAKSDFTASADPAAGAYWAAHAFVVQPQLAATTAAVAANAAALLSRFNFRGAWAATTAYARYDAVAYNGATYYRSGAAFTSGSAFEVANWVAFGAGLYTTIDYFNEYTPANNDSLSGLGGRSYVLNGVQVYPFDPQGVAAGSPLFGRVFAFRAVGTAPSTLSLFGGSTFDGAASLVLNPGEMVWVKVVPTGYTLVLDTRKGPTRDVYDVPQAVRDAVAAGTFSSGELQGAQPTGSLPAMEFTTTTYGYKYQPGAAGTLVWNRFVKG